MIDLKNIFGSNLLAEYQYSIGAAQKKVIILKEVDFKQLTEYKKYIKNLNEVPLILKDGELEKGSDVFPLEYLNLKKTYKIEYGKDFLKNLEIQKKYVRIQLELEFRSKLIHLRQEFLILKNDKELLDLMRSALNILAPVFHGLLYLKNNSEKCEKFEDYIDLLSKLYKIDFEIIEDIKSDKLELGMVNVYVEKLMTFLDALCNIVDNLD